MAKITIDGEAYEVEDAIRRRDMEALRDELGDLLLQIVSVLSRNPEPLEGEDFADSGPYAVNGGSLSQSHSPRPIPRRRISCDDSGFVSTSI